MSDQTIDPTGNGSDPALDRTKLPIRRAAFSGVANETLGGSEPGWEQIGHVKPPEGAPNVLVVLIDDAGFGNPGTFGGPIETPNYDRIADEGLRYNRFHVTAMCSPTRAALLTGRNHHAVGMGGIPEFSGGFPGYSAMLPRDAAPFPKVMKENGYSTGCVGKWHLTPEGEQGPAGPFDHWPNGWGFDYYWGFLAPDAGQDDSLSENSKRLFAHQMEVYAGYSENADHHVGRLLDSIEEMGELENTVIVWIWGDNGASLEGTPTGTFNEGTMVNGLPLTDSEQMQLALKWGGLEAWGTEMMYPHYSTAWAWAGNTPFRWGKQVASHLGGTRNPMVIRWPARVTGNGGLRSQVTHVTDIAPTIRDLAGVPQP